MYYIIKRVKEHYEVYDVYGHFLLSADHYCEAQREAEFLFAA